MWGMVKLRNEVGFVKPFEVVGNNLGDQIVGGRLSMFRMACDWEKEILETASVTLQKTFFKKKAVMIFFQFFFFIFVATQHQRKMDSGSLTYNQCRGFR